MIFIDLSKSNFQNFYSIQDVESSIKKHKCKKYHKIQYKIQSKLYSKITSKWRYRKQLATMIFIDTVIPFQWDCYSDLNIKDFNSPKFQTGYKYIKNISILNLVLRTLSSDIGCELLIHPNRTFTTFRVLMMLNLQSRSMKAKNFIKCSTKYSSNYNLK